MYTEEDWALCGFICILDYPQKIEWENWWTNSWPFINALASYSGNQIKCGTRYTGKTLEHMI